MDEKINETEVIGVQFRSGGKVYFFSPNGNTIPAGIHIVVETSRGIECGEVTMSNKLVPSSSIIQPLRSIIRIATDEDLAIVKKHRELEKSAIATLDKKIKEHNLDMKPVEVEYPFDGSKIIFYYTAPTMVDFRDLVKDLARIFHSRIELRQIGIRDEAKRLGGIGLCGREFCCSSFLKDFQAVSIKMVKDQGLSLMTSKISGACGRLLCCLKFEQDNYAYLKKITPALGSYVETESGVGKVIDNNLLTGNLTITLDKDPNGKPLVINKDNVKPVKSKKPVTTEND